MARGNRTWMRIFEVLILIGLGSGAIAFRSHPVLLITFLVLLVIGLIAFVQQEGINK